jgi:release factor glutamine methyltransferase
MSTVREHLCHGIAALEGAGVETPRLDAELLLADALGVRRIDLYAHPERLLDGTEVERWSERLDRRLRREPLSYITGRVEFFGLPFRAGPAALIPRPETEVLVEALLARLPDDAWVLDVGTGTGCIALALAHRLPQARVVALEPSAAALALARENAAALGLSERVRWVRGWFPEDVVGALDAIAANPPYIPTAEVEALAPELREYEPRRALDGGADGLDVIRSLIGQGPRLLRPGGILAMEMAAGQAEVVRELAAERGDWRDVEILPDLAGIPRVLVARTAGGGRGDAPAGRRSG